MFLVLRLIICLLIILLLLRHTRRCIYLEACFSNSGATRGGIGRCSSLYGGGQSLNGGRVEVKSEGKLSKDGRESYLSSFSSSTAAIYSINGKPSGNLIGKPRCRADCNLGTVSHRVVEMAWPAMAAPT